MSIVRAEWYGSGLRTLITSGHKESVVYIVGVALCREFEGVHNLYLSSVLCSKQRAED